MVHTKIVVAAEEAEVVVEWDIKVSKVTDSNRWAAFIAHNKRSSSQISTVLVLPHKLNLISRLATSNLCTLINKKTINSNPP